MRKDPTAALAWWAGWWLIVPVDDYRQQMPAARREHAALVE
jgi:hypothetical protein